MRLTTFSLTMGETINMGNFNNVRYEVSGTIALANATDPEPEIAELRTFLRGKALDTRRSIKGTENGVS